MMDDEIQDDDDEELDISHVGDGAGAEASTPVKRLGMAAGDEAMLDWVADDVDMEPAELTPSKEDAMATKLAINMQRRIPCKIVEEVCQAEHARGIVLALLRKGHITQKDVERNFHIVGASIESSADRCLSSSTYQLGLEKYNAEYELKVFQSDNVSLEIFQTAELLKALVSKARRMCRRSLASRSKKMQRLKNIIVLKTNEKHKGKLDHCTIPLDRLDSLWTEALSDVNHDEEDLQTISDDEMCIVVEDREPYRQSCPSGGLRQGCNR